MSTDGDVLTQDMLTQTQSVPEQLQQLLPTLPLAHARLVPILASGSSYEMREGCDEVVIGRGPECEVVLEDRRVSKRHLRIYRTGKCQYSIEQLGGNGCFVNEVCLKKGETRDLQHGDEISVIVYANETREKPIAVYLFRVANQGQAARQAVAATPRPRQEAAAVGSGHEVSERIRTDQWVRENWDMRNVLGKGYFSEVWIGMHVATGKRRAVKVVDKGKFSTFQARNSSQLVLSCEAEMLTRLEHPGIVRCFEWFETSTRLYLIMELLAGGDLLDFIIGHGCLSETVARRWFKELCDALGHLHGKNIVHRDLKPENILLTSKSEEAHLKIADFGLARRNMRSRDCRTFCGTPQYFAPEVISTFRDRIEAGQAPGAQTSGYGKEVDMWGLGVVLYIILSGIPPFGEEEGALYEQILEGRYDFDVPSWATVTPEAKDLVRRLMTVNPRERFTVKQALDHPWLQQCAEARAEGAEEPVPKRRRTVGGEDLEEFAMQ
mmetsp:Transcript_18726/g.41018  ORF Transcript_18726/g.41018 Transcript_18726/m.41018 type:complete len:494 (+) Transcript_18726:81-1562(+)